MWRIKFLTNILFTKNHLLNQGDIRLQALFYQSLFQRYTEACGYNSKEWTADLFLTFIIPYWNFSSTFWSMRTCNVPWFRLPRSWSGGKDCQFPDYCGSPAQMRISGWFRCRDCLSDKSRGSSDRISGKWPEVARAALRIIVLCFIQVVESKFLMLMNQNIPSVISTVGTYLHIRL